MALKNLQVKTKKPENLAVDEDDLEIELLGDEEDQFNPNLGLEDDDEEFEDDVKWENEAYDEDEDEFDDEENADETHDENEETDEEEDDGVENSEDGSNDEEDDETSEENRGPRENARIRQLVEERNKERERVKQERIERHKLQKQLVETQKNTIETSKNVLGQQIESYQAQMVTAQENDDNAKYVELQSKLNKAQFDLTAVEAWVAPEVSDEPDFSDLEDNSSGGVKSLADAPATVQEWANRNAWFENPVSPKDKERQAEAVAYSQVLATKGYSVESEEFFDMIDKRLEKLGLAKAKKNKVKSKNKDKTSSKRRKKKKISQTVQGASRTPSSRKKSKKNKVTLTAEQQNIARIMGMSNKEYAQELLLIEKAEQAGKRMTTLKINK